MFNFLEKDDTKIQNDVRNELLWDPSVTSGQIKVSSKDGIVTLKGSVPHYYEKMTAEKAAQRVGGIRGIADEIEVNLDSSFERSDAALAEAAHYALEWAYQVPEGIKVTVDRAWITLRGEAEWDFQRNAAKDAVSALMGVRGVTSEITLKSVIQPDDLKIRIEEAMKRSAETDGRNINVEVSGNRVTLSGNVTSLSESEDARIAAWNAPGVLTVINNLQISH
jgi:osmotically-inducible protein OsmY